MDLFKIPTVAIIGTAGRKDDSARLKPDSFDIMYGAALLTLSEWGVRAAVSGGAAWADHLAVRAYLDGNVDALHLHFPAPFAGGKFQGGQDGEIANHYHRKFAQVRGVDGLAELQRAIDKGAEVTVGRGFYARNLAVGRDATHLLAFTFGPGETLSSDCGRDDAGYRDAVTAGLKDGGTAHCWSKARGPDVKRHVDLGLLLAPAPALTP
jgi:hypothetical protein